jgi:hypothetical protein
MGHKHLCLPLASEALYREYVAPPAPSRQYLSEMLRQSPALFPHDMDQGFPLHDASVSVTQDVLVRRIQLQTTGAVFPLRPSFVMPSMLARTDAVEKALSLRQWGGPFDALGDVCGRDAMGWSRAWLACGRPSLRGTPVQDPHKVPRALVADEQLTRGSAAAGRGPAHRGRGLFPGGERG